MSVLDFGSGAGRDCFVLSKLVGKDGFVTGVDMTEEQVHANLISYYCISSIGSQGAFYPHLKARKKK